MNDESGKSGPTAKIPASPVVMRGWSSFIVLHSSFCSAAVWQP
jgi:hypothetical protein